MSHPVEDVVGGPYKPMIRFIIAFIAIITVLMLSSDRAKAFVDERVESKVRALDVKVEAQSAKIEKLDDKLSKVQDDVTEIKTEVSTIKTMLRHRER